MGAWISRGTLIRLALVLGAMCACGRTNKPGSAVAPGGTGGAGAGQAAAGEAAGPGAEGGALGEGGASGAAAGGAGEAGAATCECNPCEDCSGPGGSCLPVALRAEDNEPEGACSGETWCDGFGRCERKAQVAPGMYETCALHADGLVTCWGTRALAQGPPDDTTGAPITDRVGDDETPASVGPIALPDKVVELAAGRSYMCALFQPGNMRCWGYNDDAQLGHGDFEGRGFTDASDLDLGGVATRISAGRTLTCALLTGGNVRCWGSTQWDKTPAERGDVDLGGNTAIKLSVGQNRMYVVLPGDDARYWDPYLPVDDPSAREILVAKGKAIEVVGGLAFACALLRDGSVHCWGNALAGLGYGDDQPRADAAALPAVPLGEPAKHITAGLDHVCALLEGGRVRCWGMGANGRLGYGNIENIGDDETPASAGDVDVGGEVLELAAGHEHTCALLADDRIRCWGNNLTGQLGYGHTRDIGDDETPASAGDVPYR